MVQILNAVLFLALSFMGFLFNTGSADSVTDSNTAFYRGINTDYVFTPPNGFKMEDNDVVADGYSFAFIPQNENYDSANVIIGVTIYNLEAYKDRFSFDQILHDDTSSIRNQYGRKLAIWPVDSMFNFNGEVIPTYYFNHPDKFIPVVMISYFDAGAEMIIVDLSITDMYPRFKAEEKFDESLTRFKILQHGKLSNK